MRHYYKNVKRENKSFRTAKWLASMPIKLKNIKYMYDIILYTYVSDPRINFYLFLSHHNSLFHDNSLQSFHSSTQILCASITKSVYSGEKNKRKSFSIICHNKHSPQTKNNIIFHTCILISLLCMFLYDFHPWQK